MKTSKNPAWVFRSFMIFLLLTVFSRAGFLFAQDAGSYGPASHADVRIETYPVSPMVNGQWSLSVLVNHPNPREVNISPPRFPSSLVLERVRTEVRFIRRESLPGEAADSSGTIHGDRWTRMEFLFTPVRAGTVTVMPFEILAFDRLLETGITTVRIRETAARRSYTPRFRWLAHPASIAAGKRAEFVFELSNWDPSKNVPENFFQGRAPRNAILEEGLPNEAGEGVYRYSVYIIPLEETRIVINSFTIRQDIYNITVPAININVSPAVSGAAAANSENPDAADLKGGGTGSKALAEAIPFPEYQERRINFFKGEYSRICARVRDLWEGGQKAEALAEMRRNERDSLAGYYLAPLRRDMEEALGLGFTHDEKWLPLKLHIVSWVILAVLVISLVPALLVFRLKFRNRNVTLRRRSGFKTIIILVFIFGLALIFLEEGIEKLPMGRPGSAGRTAVLRETQAYRVPDNMGAVNARFKEGQPVIVNDKNLDWCSAESPDGRSGWVKREAVILY